MPCFGAQPGLPAAAAESTVNPSAGPIAETIMAVVAIVPAMKRKHRSGDEVSWTQWLLNN
jgi:hypothetical protein